LIFDRIFSKKIDVIYIDSKSVLRLVAIRRLSKFYVLHRYKKNYSKGSLLEILREMYTLSPVETPFVGVILSPEQFDWIRLESGRMTDIVDPSDLEEAIHEQIRQDSSEIEYRVLELPGQERAKWVSMIEKRVLWRIKDAMAELDLFPCYIGSSVESIGFWQEFFETTEKFASTVKYQAGRQLLDFSIQFLISRFNLLNVKKRCNFPLV